MHVSKSAEEHFDADANVLNAVGDVVGGEILRLEAVERARLLQGNHDDLLPKRQENDALDGPKLGDGGSNGQSEAAFYFRRL